MFCIFVQSTNQIRYIHVLSAQSSPSFFFSYHFAKVIFRFANGILDGDTGLMNSHIVPYMSRKNRKRGKENKYTTKFVNVMARSGTRTLTYNNDSTTKQPAGTCQCLCLDTLTKMDVIFTSIHIRPSYLKCSNFPT